MATKAPAQAGRSLERVKVANLTTGLNVRSDATPDPELIASVKANGVLQPPTVTPNDDGTFEIVIGHRRANAAAKAGLEEIDVIVVDGTLADAARLVDQLTENDQRLQLTETERTAGYKQLELFSVSPADIAKRLGVKRDRVDTILKVAKSESASTALAEHGITLDQAAAMVEFDGDKSATKELVAAAAAGRFDHTLQDVRRKAEVQRLRDELHKELEAAGVTRVKDANYWYDAAEGYDTYAFTQGRLGKPNDPTEMLEPSDVDKAHLGGRLITEYGSVDPFGYGQWPKIQYLLKTEAKEHYPVRETAGVVPVRELSKEEKAQQEARAKAEQERVEAAAAFKASGDVRRAWLVELLQRRTLPDWQPLLAWAFPSVPLGGEEEEISPAVLDLLGIPYPKEDFDGYDTAKLLRDRINGDTKFAPKVILAVLVQTIEDWVFGASWHQPDHVDATYLSTLAEWGYGLSEAEEKRIAIALENVAQAAADEAADEPDDVDADDTEDEDA